MKRQDALALLPIIQAFGEGATIQILAATPPGALSRWIDVEDDGTVSFNRPAWNYRIKPEPRVIYVNEYEAGRLSGQNHKSETEAQVFSTTGVVITRKFVEVL